MSVRAYKIIEIKTKKSPTFNCWNEQWIGNLSNTDDTGDILYFERYVIEGKLEELEKENGVHWLNSRTGEIVENKQKDSNVFDYTLVNEAQKQLRAILKDMGEEDDVEYYCY